MNISAPETLDSGILRPIIVFAVCAVLLIALAIINNRKKK